MTKIYANFLKLIINIFIFCLPRWKRLTVKARFYDKLRPFETVWFEGKKLNLFIPDRTSVYWAKSGVNGEPTTNAWINSFDNKIYINDPSLYLHRPSATDKSMAPEGSDCFYVLVPVPNNQSNIDWQIEGEKMKNLVIDKMENDLMPDLKSNIVSDFYLTPDYFEKELNTKYGSGFSIQPKFTQSAYFRFHNKSEIYNGLYFVGAGTHPGAGVPGVLSSAKVLDKLI